MFQSLFSAVENGEISLLSFDIFDTLIGRKVPTPRDLFLLLGKKLHAEGLLIPCMNSANFAALRSSAEAELRQEMFTTQKHSEPFLHDIYWKLRPAFVSLTTEEMLRGEKGVYESDVDRLVHMELELEKSLICFDETIMQLIAKAQTHAIPIILVSDTYINEEQMRYLLDAPSFIDHYFLSCVYGCSKSMGLFNHVLNKLGPLCAQMVHVGDDEKRDIRAATKAKIRSVHYKKMGSALKKVVERELPKTDEERLSYLDSEEGDFGFTYLRSKMDQRDTSSFFWHYGATVLAPILFGFIHWLYQRCTAMGGHTVYCLMREGRLYAELIKRLGSCYPNHNLQAKELYSSRIFMTHAAIRRADVQELALLLRCFARGCSVKHFCMLLGLDAQKIPKWAHNTHLLLDEERVRTQFLLHLATEPNLRLQILDHASKKRQRLIRYLDRIGALDSKNTTFLVDVGWNATQQGALHKIFEIEQLAVPLHGLYLGTESEANRALLRRVVSEGFLFQGGSPSYEKARRRGCFVLEQAATAATGLGPLKEITEEGVLVHYPCMVSEKQQAQAKEMQQGIFAFFDLAARHIQSKKLTLNCDSPALKNQLRALLLRSMLDTTYQEALHFSSWLHEDSYVMEMAAPLAQDSEWAPLIKDILPAIDHTKCALIWPAAYAAQESKYLTLASKALSLNTLQPECFLSQDSYPLHIFLDTGKDFPKNPHCTLQLKSNHNRSFCNLAKIFLSKKQIRRLKLSIPCPSSLIRVKKIHIQAACRKDGRQLSYSFHEKEHGLEMQPLSARQIAPATFQCEERLELIYPFEEKSIYQIRLAICCEIFSLK